LTLDTYEINKVNVCTPQVHLTLHKTVYNAVMQRRKANDEDKCILHRLPVELHSVICCFDPTIYVQWTELSKRLAYSSGRFDRKFNKHGRWMAWHTNRKIRKKANFKNGNLEKKYESWFQSGQLECLCFYKHNKKSGKYLTFFEDGNRHIEAFYKADLPAREYKVWHNRAFGCKSAYVLERHESYENGEMVGDWVYSYFGFQGKVKMEVYRAAKRSETSHRISWYKSGQMQSREYSRNGYLHGESTFWDKKGIVRRVKFYNEKQKKTGYF